MIMFVLNDEGISIVSLLSTSPEESVFGYKWDVPVSYITSANSTVQRSWFYHENSTCESYCLLQQSNALL